MKTYGTKIKAETQTTVTYKNGVIVETKTEIVHTPTPKNYWEIR